MQAVVWTSYFYTSRLFIAGFFFFFKKEQILSDTNLAYKWCWVWQGLSPNAIQRHQETLRYNNVTVGPRIPPLPPKADFTNSEPTYAQNFLPVTL